MHTGERIRDYVLEQRIGEGGMGEVWRAQHQGLQRTVAIKVIRERVSNEPDFHERFIQEAQAMARLAHPHIVPVHDFFESGGTGFLVMGLIDGGSLEGCGRMELSAALSVSDEILDALNFAHQQGVIHRDVKPSNILIDQRGHAYITDFGIALVAGQKRITRLTRAGAAIGTPEYMSPEQITTPQDIDQSTDVYSFGCVLYEMLTGSPPFGSRDQGTTEFELMEAHVRKPPPSLRKSNPKVDRNTEEVIARALAKNRDQRFAGCGEMAEALLGGGSRVASGPPQRVTLTNLLFSFKGRLSRSQYWKGALIVAFFDLLMSSLVVAALANEEEDLALAFLVLSILGVWPGLALAVKRWHDRDRTAWWFLTWLIPYLQIVPIVWMLIEIGFLKGTDGPNRYGEDRLRTRNA